MASTKLDFFVCDIQLEKCGWEIKRGWNHFNLRDVHVERFKSSFEVIMHPDKVRVGILE